MRTTVLMILLIVSTFIYGFEVIDTDGKSYNVDRDLLAGLQKEKLSTDRDKKGKQIHDDWEGVRLSELFNKLGISEFEIVELNSSDNYQVKLTKEQVNDNIPILALMRNKEALDENNIRLVVTGLRDLYWISELKNIRLLKSAEYPEIGIIHPFSDIKERIRLIENPKPFTKCKGYLFSEMVESLQIKPEFNVRIVSEDNLVQELNYQDYLEKAVLILSEDGTFELRSPSMPGGMWQKKIKMLIIDNLVIYFDKNKEKVELHTFKGYTDKIDLAEYKVITKKKAKKANIWNEIEYLEIKK